MFNNPYIVYLFLIIHAIFLIFNLGTAVFLMPDVPLKKILSAMVISYITSAFFYLFIFLFFVFIDIQLKIMFPLDIYEKFPLSYVLTGFVLSFFIINRFSSKQKLST